MANDTKPNETEAGSGDEAAAEAKPQKAAASQPATSEIAAVPEVEPAAPVDAAQTPEEIARTQSAEARAARSRGDVEARPVRAVAKYLRFSARKGRLVADQIRGRTVVEAATLLRFGERDAAREIMKVLKSAVANAENNHGFSIDELYVQAAFVDEGPTFKRWKPRARGRVDRINKRTCHVTVVVSTAPAELLEQRDRRKAAPSRSARVAASKAKDAVPQKISRAGKKPAAEKESAE